MASTFIYLLGADGTGKSTQAQLLLGRLHNRGIACRLLWLRFPFFFSVPLLGYARWRGYSWHEVEGGVNYGYWKFEGSRLLSRVLPLTLLADAALGSLVFVYLPLWMGTTIVCERYVLDIVADLSIAGVMPMSGSWMLQLFVKLLPAHALVIGLTAPRDLVVSRRPELQHDRTLDAKLRTYREIFEALACPVISTADPISRVHERIVPIAEARLSAHSLWGARDQGCAVRDKTTDRRQAGEGG